MLARGGSFGRSVRVLGTSGRVLGRLGGAWGGPGAVLGPSRCRPGAVRDRSWVVLGGSRKGGGLGSVANLENLEILNLEILNSYCSFDLCKEAIKISSFQDFEMSRFAQSQEGHDLEI